MGFQMKHLHCILPLLLTSSLFAESPNLRLVLCSDSNACKQTYQNGEFVQTITDGGRTISLSARDTGKYLRVDVSVKNETSAPFDVIPASIWARQVEPKKRVLKPQSAAKLEHGLERRAAWANGFTGFAGGMARQQVTTNTNTSGNVSVYGNDGSSAYGNYSGTSTSTTSVPDYAAQQRASQQIAANRQRVANAEQYLEGAVLRSNTLSAGQAAAGSVYFDRAKLGGVDVGVPLGDAVYQFPVEFSK